GGLFVRREDNGLFLGTGATSAVKVNGEWELRYDGPVVEVVTTHDTLIYRDETLGQLGGVAPSGPIQQVLKPGSLDELDENSTVKVWGETSGDSVVAEVIVFSAAVDDSGVSPEGGWTNVYTPPVSIVELVIESTSGESMTRSSETQSVPGSYAYSTSVVGTPYGYDLNAETPSQGSRSDQMVRQSFHDRGGALLGYVELSEGPAYGRQILNSVARGWALAGSVAVLLAALAGWMASRRITRPLLALTDVTGRMAGGDLSARADVKRQDELGLLARSFNQMAAQVEDTVGTLRRFVADAAHELHTPLTALRTNLELVADEQDRGQQRDYVDRAQMQVQRLATLTNILLDLSRLETAPAQQPQAPVNLVDLLQETCELYASRAEQAGLTFSLDLPSDPVTISGAAAQMRQALGNLLDNAIKFTPQAGEIRVGLRREGEWAHLWVQDTGIGIPNADIPQLFSRFHRGGNASAYPGSGLGLAIVKAIVTAHRGHVAVQSTGQGSRFSIEFPS
ncbi:MAG: HAMP domain-containing histidine kinase, partial [Anaerolineae bacterium]